MSRHVSYEQLLFQLELRWQLELLLALNWLKMQNTLDRGGREAFKCAWLSECHEIYLLPRILVSCWWWWGRAEKKGGLGKELGLTWSASSALCPDPSGRE